MSLETTITHVITQNPAGVALETILKKTRGNATDHQAVQLIDRMVAAKKIILANGKYTAAAAPASQGKDKAAPPKAAAPAKTPPAAAKPKAPPAALLTTGKTRDKILALIEAQPQSAADISGALQIEDALTSYHVNRLKKDGLIQSAVNPENRRAPIYSRTSKAAAVKPAAVKPNAAPPPRATPSKPVPAPVPSNMLTTIDRLATASTEAQAALEQYMTSCCDPAILDMLQRSRDATQAALQQLQGKAA